MMQFLWTMALRLLITSGSLRGGDGEDLRHRETACAACGADRIGDMRGPIRGNQGDGRTSKAAAGQASADSTRRHRCLDRSVDFGHRDLEVVTHGRMRGEEKIPDGLGSRLGQRLDGR